MANKGSDKYLEPWEYFLRLHSEIVSRIEGDLSKAGCIPLTWYDVLLVVDAAPEGRLKLSEIAEKIVLSRSALTRSVDRLVDEGLLKRERCTEDKRSYFGVITEKGRRALERAWPVYRGGIVEYFARDLSSAELGTLLRTFEKIYSKFDS